MAMEDFDFFAEEDEEGSDEEGEEVDEKSNRTFIILMAALGGLLAVGVCAFVIWMAVIAPRMRSSIVDSNQAIVATNEAVAATTTAMAEAVETEAAAPTNTPAPTKTPAPTATPRPSNTPVATSGDPSLEAATITPRATATRRATPAGSSGSGEVPNTGIGVFGIAGLAAGLIIVLFLVRRVRRSAQR